MARKADEKPDCKFYLVIDEINRGVMGRIFGELILTLEYRDFDVHLPGLDEPLRVPNNLFLIGTMNTADRNIALIDHALRRRFMVLKMLPEMRQLESYHEDEDVEEALQNLSKEAFNIVQTPFKKGDEYDEDKNGYNMEDYAVGHTYFMAKSEAKLKAKVEHQVIPLLGEYMREGIIDKSKYASVKSELEQLLGLGVSRGLSQTNSDGVVYKLNNDRAGPKIKGISGFMEKRDSKFVVLKGSGSICPKFRIEREEKKITKLKDNTNRTEVEDEQLRKAQDLLEWLKSIDAKRTNHIEKGQIEVVDNDHGIFTEDVEFESASAAAIIVRGTSISGPGEWKLQTEE